MSIFTKPVFQLRTSDLQELLSEKAVEGVRLEFKSEGPTKDETLKKLSSFANTFGGFMVIGAKANSSDGRIEDLPGVDEESGYKQKVVDWCFNGASPPLIDSTTTSNSRSLQQATSCVRTLMQLWWKSFGTSSFRSTGKI